MSMTFPKLASYKIAVLNCYLQGGHTDTAEVEAGKRLEIAAANVGLSARMFARSEELYDYEPDIVLCHAYQDAKLTPYPTYGTLTMPPSWVKDVPRFVRNILSYDGYITLSESVIAYVKNLSAAVDKELPSVFAAFSVPQTDYKPLNFASAHAAYLGTNWDGSRHGNFFSLFENSGLLKCYGPQKNWAYLSKTVYGHPVPFDGKSVLDVYRSAGIGLCFNHKDFDNEGIPTSRVFEIPASSAFMIAKNNPLIKSLFGDSVLYLDSGGSPQELAVQVKESVLWVRANTKRAEEMAQQANHIFNEKLCMEKLLMNLVEAHEKRLVTKQNKTNTPIKSYYNARTSNKTLSVICNYTSGDLKSLKTFLQAMQEQVFPPREVYILHECKWPIGRRLKKDEVLSLVHKYENAFDVHYTQVFSSNVFTRLKNLLPSISSNCLAYMQDSDEPFPEHFALSLAQNENDSATYSGVVEYSASGASLKELIQDGYNVPRKEAQRLTQFTNLPQAELNTHAAHINLSSMVFSVSLLKEHINNARNMSELLNNLKASYTFVPYVTLRTQSKSAQQISFFHLAK